MNNASIAKELVNATTNMCKAPAMDVVAKALPDRPKHTTHSMLNG